MRTPRCWTVLLVAGALSVPAPPVAHADTPAPAQGCPVGQHEDTESPGFQCVTGWCPTGMLLDGVTHACVAAPGVPPEPLPGG